MDRFDLEQQILSCWNIIDDIKRLNVSALDGASTDDISNYLLGLETIYNLKFEDLFNTFEKLIAVRKII